MIKAQPLDSASFAPFGTVLRAPDPAGRDYFDEGLVNLRPGARASLSIARVVEPVVLPFAVKLMERHEFSSQSFVPMQVARWLVVVAPHGDDGGPDIKRMQAFIAGPEEGIVFGADIWHHPLTVLDGPGSFAIGMWLADDGRDEEFRDLPEAVTVSG
jgi:ureidoglycolate lyase